jgi:hypothetical protein
MRSTLLSLPATRRSVVIVLGGMLLALAVVVMVSVVASKRANAAEVVHRLFDQPEQILIPAGAIPANCGSGPTQGKAGPFPSRLRIQDFPAGSTITDVNLKLRGFTHTFPDDVGVILSKGVQPGRLVMEHVGDGDNVSDITLTLDDEAANDLPDEDALVTGRFKPTNGYDKIESLAAFDGLSPNGNWTLRVVDHVDGDCGELGDGWSLRIEARVP